jgi:transcriptional regulator with XRE-family HTH domain
MNDEFENKEYRDAFVEENVRNGIAFQIRALRKRQQLSQGELGGRAGMAQNAISRLENPEYGKFTINTLFALASAFDVALSVKFV